MHASYSKAIPSRRTHVFTFVHNASSLQRLVRLQADILTWWSAVRQGQILTTNPLAWAVEGARVGRDQHIPPPYYCSRHIHPRHQPRPRSNIVDLGCFIINALTRSCHNDDCVRCTLCARQRACPFSRLLVTIRPGPI